MPPLSLVQYLAACLTIVQNGWRLAQAVRAKLDAAELERLHAELDESYLRLKSLATTQEIKDDATDLARSHRDILR